MRALNHPPPAERPAPDPAADLPLAGGRALGGLAAAVLVAAWACALLWPAGPTARGDGPASWLEVDAVLDAAAEDPAGRSVLLLGDSVLAGTVSRDRGVPGWERQTVPALLDSLSAAGPAVGFHDLSMPALLPGDVHRLVERLDQRDPAGRVELVVELSPRYFSRVYANIADPVSRPFLSDPPPGWASSGLLGDVRRLGSLFAERRGGFGGVHQRISSRVAAAWKGPGAAGGGGEAEPDLALLRLRVRPHFLDLDLGDGNPQVRALDAAVEGIRARGRRALFFLTPLNESFLAEPEERPDLYAAAVRIAARVPDSETVRLVHLDGPAFGEDRFLDHCHLTPEGNRVLAGQLLEALRIPSRAALADADRAIPSIEGDDGYVVGGISPGHQDGLATQVLFRGPEDAVVLPGGDLIVADTGNHVLRRIRPLRRTAETWVGATGEAGGRDGSGTEARFHSPSRVASDGRGGVFVIDRGTDVLRHVSPEGKVRHVPPYDRPRPGERDLVDVAAAGGTAFVIDARRREVLAIPGDGGPPLPVVAWAELELVSLDSGGDGTLWLVARNDGLHRLDPRAAPQGGGTGPPILGPGSRVAAARPEAPAPWPATLESIPIEELPLLDPLQVVAAGAEGRVLLRDHDGPIPRLWEVRPASGTARLLDPPGAGGRSLEGRVPLHWDAVAAADPETGDLYWTSPTRSYVTRWSSRLQSRSWRVDADPGPAAVERRRDVFRLAVTGTSMAAIVADSPHQSARSGLPARLERVLGAAPLLQGTDVEVLDLGRGGQSLVDALARLVSLPPGAVDMAVFTLDHRALRDLAAVDGRTRWGDDGLPLLSFGGAPIPLPPPAGPPGAEGEGDARGALRRVVRAIRTWSDRERVAAVVADIRALDTEDPFGLDAGRPGEADFEEVRREVRAMGIPVIDLGEDVAPRLSGAHPIHGSGTHYLNERGMDLVAHLLGTRLEGRIAAHRERPRGEPAARGDGGAGTDRPPQDLSGPVTARWGIPDARVSVYREGVDLGLMVDATGADRGTGRGPDPAPDSWARALFAAARHGPRAEPGQGIVVAFVTFATRNEYGDAERQGVQALARYRIDASDVAAAVSGADALLASPSPVRPRWLRDDGGGEGARAEAGR